MFIVYIIHSVVLDQYYVGMTGDLARRLKEHRGGKTRSVPASTDWTVVWSVPIESSDGARELEKRIKGRGANRFLKDMGVA